MFTVLLESLEKSDLTGVPQPVPWTLDLWRPLTAPDICSGSGLIGFGVVETDCSTLVALPSAVIFRMMSQEPLHCLYCGRHWVFLQVYIWRVYLQKTINGTLKKKDCRALFSTYSAIWTLNTFCQKSLYCPLSRHREFTFYCRSRQAPLLFLNRSW